jgi:hypothetical protein
MGRDHARPSRGVSIGEQLPLDVPVLYVFHPLQCFCHCDIYQQVQVRHSYSHQASPEQSLDAALLQLEADSGGLLRRRPFLINLQDDLDKFDERMVRAISHHMALRHQRRHLADPEEQEQATSDDDDAETLVPTGAYDYSKAHQFRRNK